MKRRRLEIRIKRVYEKPASTDGKRILVDRLWPRGLSKNKAAIDAWVKEIAPSNQLRQWYQHDPDKWEEFKTRYSTELDSNTESVEKLLAEIPARPVTFLFSSREEQLNNAVALKEYLESFVRNR